MGEVRRTSQTSISCLVLYVKKVVGESTEPYLIRSADNIIHVS